MSHFYPELDNLNLKELIQRFNDLNYNPHKFIYFPEVTDLIREKGEEGNAFLIERLRSGEIVDEDRFSALIVALITPSAEKYGILPLKDEDLNFYQKLLISRLQSDDPHVVEEALIGLHVQKVKGVLDEVLALQNHPFKYVRESVLRYLSRLYPAQAFPVLLKSLKDSAYEVRVQAIEELGLLDLGGELGSLSEAEIVTYLRPLLSDPEIAVQEAAKNSIEYLEFSEQYLAVLREDE